MTLKVVGGATSATSSIRVARGRSADASSPGRVAMISVHTSPLDQPGTGDAGGMNVYIVELARELARTGTEVEIFTRATSGAQPAIAPLVDGVVVRHVAAGPFEGLTKSDLPGQLCTFAREVLRTEATHAPGYYDVIHSHYWLSGQVGALARDRWGVPLVHSMHTMARVKNATLADGDLPEPAVRLIGEEQVVAASDLVIATTDDERRQLIDLYGADADQVRVVRPGVNLEIFTPASKSAARRRLDIPDGREVVLFVGRIQPLKAPDLLIRAIAELVSRDPAARERLVVPIVGGPSGSGVEAPRRLVELAGSLGVADLVRFVPPVRQRVLADYYRAASLVVVPSYSESFGLVAIEAQACGTPVIAARVGGLPTAVEDGVTGVLVDGHDVTAYADVIARLLAEPARLRVMGEGGVARARTFGWARTAKETLAAYRDAIGQIRVDQIAAVR